MVSPPHLVERVHVVHPALRLRRPRPHLHPGHPRPHRRPSGVDGADAHVLEALADGLLDAAVLMRLENTQRSPGERSPAWVERQAGKVRSAIRAMSAGLGEHPYCTGNHFTLADVTVGCALHWLDFRFPEISWRGDHTRLARLADKLAERPSFRDTMPQ